MKFDLHLHTTASDGTDAPSEVVRLALQGGFETIAITDHDTMDGVAEAEEEGRRRGVRVIAGVEISAAGEKEVHVLGYGLQNSPVLSEKLAEMRRQRDLRMRRMVEKLNAIGVDITLEEAVMGADGAVGRSHLARALVKRGDARDVRDAFSRYLSPGKPAYVPREKLSVEGAIRIIRSAGGIPVIAHPGQERAAGYWNRVRLEPLIRAGLMGLECYHPSHTARQCAELMSTCRRLGLLVTGGSDYHGTVKPVRMGDGLDRWAMREEDFQRFMHKLEWGKL